MFVRVIDQNGFLVEEAFVDNLAEFTIKTPCPCGFYKPRWNGTQWVEGLAQAEIEKIKNIPTSPTIEEQVQALSEAVTALMGV